MSETKAVCPKCLDGYSDQKLEWYKNEIEHAILHKGPSPSEACKLLAEGIRWYNSTTQNKEQS